jgi:hypothetical protein
MMKKVTDPRQLYPIRESQSQLGCSFSCDRTSKQLRGRPQAENVLIAQLHTDVSGDLGKLLGLSRTYASAPVTPLISAKSCGPCVSS